MTLTDLTIIYLACGSPFAVYHITRRLRDRAVRYWMGILTSFLFWPVFAAALARQHYLSREHTLEAVVNARIENIRVEIERIAFPAGSTSSLFEFREVFHRFTGLSQAANSKSPARPSNEVFDVSGHRNKALASECLARRNRDRLAYHQTLARNEFIDIIAGLAADNSIGDDIGRLALELASDLDDAAAAADLMALLPNGPKLGAIAGDKEASPSAAHSVAA